MDWITLPETDSTNRVAKELARQGAAHGTAVLAARQTAGRGRLGRQFFSPEGGLYLSVILRPQLEPRDLPLMTPMAAVAVCTALEQTVRVRPDIKWVNDLYLGGKKLCGILCESTGEAVIVGIGINLRTPPEGFPPELNAVSLEGRVSAEVLAQAIRRELCSLCDALPETNFVTEYRAHSLVLGREITVHPAAGQPYPAKAVDMDSRCRLVVETAAGRTLLDSGELSIRL